MEHQIAQATHNWELKAVAVVLVLGVVFKFILDLYQRKNERAASTERLQVLRDIAESNKAIREGQVAQNGKLSQVVSVNDAHHAELIRAIGSSCKARNVFPTVNQEKT